jgi:hypothetical protein
VVIKEKYLGNYCNVFYMGPANHNILNLVFSNVHGQAGDGENWQTQVTFSKDCLQ